MLLQGLQKLTLLDFPGKVACTVFTGGCNLRCPFCHNASLVLRKEENPVIPEEEFFSFLQKRQGLLEGVCVSGGEPLLQKGIADFLDRIHKLGYKIKLDTNGCFPERLKEVVCQGLVDYVAMDIKSAPEHYGRLAGLSRFDIAPVQESVEYLLSGPVAYEFRTTAVKGLHEAADFPAIGRWIKGAERYYLQGFVASRDLIGGEEDLSSFSEEEMEAFRQSLLGDVPAAKLRGI